MSMETCDPHKKNLGPCTQLKKSQKQLETKESEMVCVVLFSSNTVSVVYT